jgi:hypothetical protein
MTMRERMLAVVEGRRPDRVPFVLYTDLAPLDELAALVGAERFGLLPWVRPYAEAAPRCRISSENLERDGRRLTRRTLYTPVGELVEERTHTLTGEANIYPVVTQHFVQTPADYAVLLAYLRDLRVTPDGREYDRLVAWLGERGIPQATIGRTPLMALLLEWVGTEALWYHLDEAPGTVAEAGAALGDLLLARAQAARECAPPYVCIPDNLHGPLLGPVRFREHCVPWYRRVAAILGDRPLYVHADGALAAFREELAGSGLGGLESVSPPPDGDLAVPDMLDAWPRMRLAFNFPSSVHLRPAAEIRDCARRLLSDGAATGRVQLQISENMPPGAWRWNVPLLIEAVERWGNL